MLELIVLLRASQLFTHHAHLVVKGSLFNQDHEFLSDIYQELESDFDAVSERMIGLGKEAEYSLPIITQKIAEKLKSAPTSVKENKDFFKYQLELEKQICQQVNALCKTPISEGTKQLIGDVGNRSEIRQYKLSRRIS